MHGTKNYCLWIWPNILACAFQYFVDSASSFFKTEIPLLIEICNAAAAKLFQSCPTLCDPIDSSPPGSPVPGILKARMLEWVAISFSNAWKWKVKVKSLSRVLLLATPWTAAHQAPLSMGLSRQEYCSGVPLPSLEICNEYIYKKNSYHFQKKRMILSKYMCRY